MAAAAPGGGLDFSQVHLHIFSRRATSRSFVRVGRRIDAYSKRLYLHHPSRRAVSPRAPCQGHMHMQLVVRVLTFREGGSWRCWWGAVDHAPISRCGGANQKVRKASRTAHYRHGRASRNSITRCGQSCGRGKSICQRWQPSRTCWRRSTLSEQPGDAKTRRLLSIPSTPRMWRLAAIVALWPILAGFLGLPSSVCLVWTSKRLLSTCARSNVSVRPRETQRAFLMFLLLLKEGYLNHVVPWACAVFFPPLQKKTPFPKKNIGKEKKTPTVPLRSAATGLSYYRQL